MLPISHFEHAFQYLTRAQCIFLINHRRMDGDAFGSLMAMYSILKTFPEKQVFALNDMIPEETLLEFSENIFQNTIPKCTPDLIVSFDAGSTGQLWTLYEQNVHLFEKTPWINIDHHISNNHFGNIHLVDTTASSTCELVWYGIENWNWEKLITPQIATFLMIGLVTDTNNFTNSNTTAEAFYTATKLLEYWADHQKIIQKFFKSKPLRRLELGKYALQNVELHFQNRLALLVIDEDIFQKTKTTYEDLSGMLDEYFMKIVDIEVWCIMAQLDKTTRKLSTRTKSDGINLCDFCAKWWWWGHARASGCTIQKNGATLKKEIIEEFGKYFPS